MGSVITQGPLLRMGTRLQHIPSRHHRDHVPVPVTLRIALRQRVRHSVAPVRWDRDPFAQAARKGHNRNELIQDLENKVENYDAHGEGIDQLVQDIQG
eukprot:7152588-Pyramimonas_sp.AAC.1